MWKKVMAVFCLILAVSLVGLSAVQRQQATEQAQELKELNATIQQLQAEKSKLEQELHALTGQEEVKGAGQTNGIVCFTSIDRRLFTEVYPKLKARGYGGVFILGNGRLPGDYNTITVEECQELLDADWSFGISLTGDFDSAESWQTAVLEYLNQIRERMGILPTIYCFAEGKYSADSVAFLARNGLSTVLYREETPVEAVDGVMQIPLYGYLGNRPDLEANASTGLEVQIIWDQDTDTGLRYTVDDLSDVLEHSGVTIGSFSSLEALTQKREEQKEKIQSAASEISALQEQISAIDDEIERLYH